MNDSSDAPLAAALRSILRPVARLLVARGLTLGAVQTLLKQTLVEAAQAAPGGPHSQSRLALMTGVHRKDVRDILESGLPGREPPRATVPETVIGRWIADPSLRADGGPVPLHRLAAQGEPSFESLVGGVSTDVRPRAVLDELLRLGLVEADDDMVRVAAAAMIPQADDGRLLELFADNVADHAATAVDNLLAGSDGRRRLERAVFYDHLSPASVAMLEREAEQLAMDALIRLNNRARELQEQDVAAGHGSQRFRFGSYFHSARMPDTQSGRATPDDPDADPETEDTP